MKTVLLLSGGLDSGVLLTKLVRDGVEVYPISFAYGQRHQNQELERAKDLARWFGLTRHKIVDISSLFSPSNESVLLNPNREMPHLTYQEIESGNGPSPTYVPFRNGILLSIASGLALQVGAESVAIATHAEDARGWAYPDCTFEFNGPMASAIYVGSYHKIRLEVPFQWYLKRDIVGLGLSIDAPFARMWSCYEGRDAACGKCPTCIERLDAFQRHGVVDPIQYEVQ